MLPIIEHCPSPIEGESMQVYVSLHYFQMFLWCADLVPCLPISIITIFSKCWSGELNVPHFLGKVCVKRMTSPQARFKLETCYTELASATTSPTGFQWPNWFMPSTWPKLFAPSIYTNTATKQTWAGRHISRVIYCLRSCPSTGILKLVVLASVTQGQGVFIVASEFPNWSFKSLSAFAQIPIPKCDSPKHFPPKYLSHLQGNVQARIISKNHRSTVHGTMSLSDWTESYASWSDPNSLRKAKIASLRCTVVILSSLILWRDYVTCWSVHPIGWLLEDDLWKSFCQVK